jgi:hypothetical protein
MIALLPLLLAATPVADNGAKAPRPAVRLATASVTIVQAERIAPTLAEGDAPKPDRQVRQREQKPLVEFF